MALATSPRPSTYHQQVAAEKRAAILSAATRLFLRSGYALTSLAAIAQEADVSRATLFKQFPTKAVLFDAMVGDAWKLHDDAGSMPPVGDLRQGLELLGTQYVALLTRPGMVDLFRIVIAETHRFPELGRRHFDLGKLPFYDSVLGYLRSEHQAGTVHVEDLDTATTQFLGMISNHVFWPRMLLLDWNPTKQEMDRTVKEATLTLQSRYATP